MNAEVWISDERQPIEDGGNFVWRVSFGTTRHVAGGSLTRELAAKAVALAIHAEQDSRDIHAYYDAHSHTNSGD